MGLLQSSAKDKDVVIHCAAQTAVTTSVKDPRSDFEVNALGSFNVLESARLSNSDPIVFYFSTNKVYGNNVNNIAIAEKKERYEFSDPNFANGIPETFSADANEHTPYGCSKYVGDLFMRDYSAVFGLRTVTFRCSCMYGYRQFGNEDQGYLAHFIISNVLGRPLILYGDGKQVRDNLFITDLVNLFDMSIIRMMQEISGKTSEISYGDWRPFDQKVYISDISKIKKAIGWEPKMGVKSGVKELVNWVESNKGMFG
jgi:CDP-paratose 2-epimerase